VHMARDAVMQACASVLTMTSSKDSASAARLAAQHVKGVVEHTEAAISASWEIELMIKNGEFSAEFGKKAREASGTVAAAVNSAREICSQALQEVSNARDFALRFRDLEENKASREAEIKMLALLPTCSACKQKVTSGQLYIQHPPYHFHRDCFRCAKCEQPLEKLEFVVDNGDFWCLPDFSKYKALKCAACSASIMDDNYLRTDNLCYHPQCLVCHSCSRNLATVTYYMLEDKALCPDCAHNL